jgi:peptidoglycan/xylan/chitin deacetylase (PgdA/CDA1 family)
MARWMLPLAAALSLLSAAACGSPPQAPAAPVRAATAAAAPRPQPAPHPATASAATSVAAQHGPFAPNELGEIPILEFHNIASPEGRWQSTPEQLRAILADLYTKGFRPVTFGEVVARAIDIPRGYAPVVLTFDDGDPSQFQWAPGGQGSTPDPNTAVGILWAFHLAHPDWPAAASFYVNRNPFGSDSAAKVAWLVAHGFEVGDHTLDHVDMTTLDAARMLQEVGGLAAWVQGAAPGYRVRTLAYPYGFSSKLPGTAWAGTIDGQSYHIRGALLVAGNPAPSPYSRAWNPLAVPRIQVADPATVTRVSDRALVWSAWEPRLLADGGALLYVSDGDPATVTIRPGEQGQLAADVPAASVVVAAPGG